ncbi:MAG: MFS transporter [Algisphaera sp.]
MSSPAAPKTADDTLFTPLWRNISFTLMWTSTAASGFGDRMIMLASLALLGGLAANTDSTSIQAGTQFWFFLPYVFFAVFGGWLADRLPRKWVLFTCDETRAGLLFWAYFSLAAAGGMAVLAPEAHWRVFAMLFMIGIFAAIFNPTRNAIVPQIVDRSQLQPANALVLVIGVVFSMIGMVVGGWLIVPEDAGSVRMGLLMGATFYLVSGTFFAFMRPKPAHSFAASSTATSPPETQSKTSIADALSYALHHKRVLKLIATDVLVWSAAALMFSGVIGLCKAHFGLEGKELLEDFSYISAVLGVGMLAGAIVVAGIRTRHESGTVIGTALVMAGLSVIAVSMIPYKPVTYTGAFLVGLFGNIAIVTVLSMLQSIVPNHVRGAVLGLNAMMSTLFSVIIYFTIWQMSNADAVIIYALMVLGPILMAIGAFTMLNYLRHGPMPSVAGNVFRHGVRLFVLVWHRARWVGRHHIPATGPVVLACNHTTALDPFVMQSASPRMIRWLMLTSYRFPLLEPFWRLINPICLEMPKGADKAEPGIKQVRQIVSELKKGDIVGIFPEGNLQYEKRILKPFEHGVATCARLSGAAIVPCWIHGTPKSRHMLVHFFRPTHTTLYFGKPFTPGRKESVQDITAELRRRMIALAPDEVEEEAETSHS